MSVGRIYLYIAVLNYSISVIGLIEGWSSLPDRAGFWSCIVVSVVQSSLATWMLFAHRRFAKCKRLHDKCKAHLDALSPLAGSIYNEHHLEQAEAAYKELERL